VQQFTALDQERNRRVVRIGNRQRLEPKLQDFIVMPVNVRTFRDLRHQAGQAQSAGCQRRRPQHAAPMPGERIRRRVEQGWHAAAAGHHGIAAAKHPVQDPA
jgi:hypothetical protein